MLTITDDAILQATGCKNVIIQRKNELFILHSALRISDFRYLFLKPAWHLHRASKFRWTREKEKGQVES